MIQPMSDTQTTLLLGDCLEQMRSLPDNSVDAIVTDPPYGLGKEPDAVAMLQDWLETGHHDVKSTSGFMGKSWDAFVPQPMQWRECFRVLKPGGHVLAFAGTRTQDLMALGLRLAGFEIRDMVAWVYGSGFPKSLDVSKALDKMAGAEREVVGQAKTCKGNSGEQQYAALGSFNQSKFVDITAPATDAAKQWDGWGTALKPALEPITLARKPLEGTVAANVLKWHTGGINVDGCRVGISGATTRTNGSNAGKERNTLHGGNFGVTQLDTGRWPANLIHDGSDEVVGLFPTTGKSTGGVTGKLGYHGADGSNPGDSAGGFGDSGSAARFFYCAKTSKADRNEGCDALPDQDWSAEGACIPERANRPFEPSKNNHPTVKPTSLMQYLCRLITPPGGTILDPFMGSGSTGKAAAKEGFSFIGIERDPSYFSIAQARISAAKASQPQPPAE